VADSKRCNKCKKSLALSAFENKGWGRRRGTCKKCRGGEQEPAKELRFHRSLDSQYYIITGAQNATPVEAAFWKVLQVAAEHLSAELVVVPYRYKNPNSLWTGAQESDEWWADEVSPYLFNVRKKLNPNLVLAADVKTQPTASSPLSSFEGLTGAESCIIVHPKMQMTVVPAPTSRYPKILTTTGTCTRRNYTDTKAGKLGAFHHFLGGLIVEQRGSKFFHHQINADRATGSFTWLDWHFTAAGVVKAAPALGLVCGDIHQRVICPNVDRATFKGSDSIVGTLNPECVVVHDGIDGSTVNPHEVGNPFLAAARAKAGLTNVEDEIREFVEFIADRVKGRKTVIVDSNHHDFIARWILRTDWKQDLRNAPFYLETAQAMLASAKWNGRGGEYADPFVYWVNKFAGDADIQCLGPDESFRLADIEVGMHGHRGPNGSRGTLKNLSRLGSRVISGHTHTPGIEEGHYKVGTSTLLRLQYTHGPSSWLNTHCSVYATGKRALLNIIDGEWRT
jgi:hypothetical protein